MEEQGVGKNAERMQHSDIHIYQCGGEQCERGHSYGPAIRDHFLIHYIHKGKGIFQADGVTYELSAGDGFLICPDVPTIYKADEKEPWEYFWVGFHGRQAEGYLREAGLTRAHPVFSYHEDSYIDDCFSEMASAYYLKQGSMVKRMAYLYLFLYRLIRRNPSPSGYSTEKSRQELYITEALHYIEANYSRKISIEKIAGHVGLNRSYLSFLFKTVMGKSLSQYLIEFRIRKACDLLANEKLTVRTVAFSVGYTDPLLFSKTFKKQEGCSPSDFRQRLINEDTGEK